MKNLLKRLKTAIKNKENRIYVILLGLAAVLMVAGAVWEIAGNDGFDTIIERNDYGGGDRIITAIAETELDGKTVSEEVVFNIGQRELSEDEIKKRFKECKSYLAKTICGENENTESVVTDLALVNEHKPTGIRIVWESSRPELIDEEGCVYPGESEDNGYVLLTANLYLDDESDEWKCNVRHRAYVNSQNVDKYIKKGLDEFKNNIAADGEAAYVELPENLGNGIKLSWKAAKENRFFICALMVVVLALFIKSKRKSELKKKKQARKQEIEDEFPYFLDKLVMLLSAGLILSEAVGRIAEDYARYTRPRHQKVLYEELSQVVRSMKETNSSFAQELTKMSERLEIREFARLSVILRDSLESGMSLVDKLEEESVLMWYERKSAVQKLGRVADTKLIFPLMIILSVLIVIVMAPTLMQM